MSLINWFIFYSISTPVLKSRIKAKSCALEMTSRPKNSLQIIFYELPKMFIDLSYLLSRSSYERRAGADAT